MTHDKIFQFTTCRTHQRCDCIDRSVQLSGGGGNRIGRPIQYFETSGISLCEGSWGYWKTGSDSRSEDCFYRQAISQSYSDTSSIFTIKGANLKRNSHTGLGSFLLQRSTTWSGRSPERLSWSIALIDSRPRKLAKSTSFWCPTKYGQRIADNNV